MKPYTAEEVQAALNEHASAYDAQFLQRYFKTGKGQYGAGDKFIGVRMPTTRRVARQFKNLPLPEIQKLLSSPVHEYRMAGLIILTLQYPNSHEQQKQSIYDFYLKNLYAGRINNWDLIDVTAKRIIGAHLLTRPRQILFELAGSSDLWQRRAGVMSSFAFIENGDANTSLQLAELLFKDRHDLIQKAVGWMLREVGSRCGRPHLIKFLDEHAHEMPRTMLRYSMEHLSPGKRRFYMSKKTDGID